jgi:ABC-type antimicrobial peptide transport system permease subunit
MLSKLLLAVRLAVRDVRRRPAQALLLLLAITAASGILTMALVLHGVTSHPYQQTRAATRGPDVVALLGAVDSVSVGPKGAPPGHGLPTPKNAAARIAAQAAALIHAPGVTAHSGPFQEAGAVVKVRGLSVAIQVEGRGQTAVAVDQPKLTAGSWVRPGGIVLERAFADALGVGVGDRITLNGRPFTVAGLAVTAAETPYPNLCFTGGCNTGPPGNGQLEGHGAGLGWATQSDVRVLAATDGPGSAAYVLNLKLSDPASAPAFINAYYHRNRVLSQNSPVSLLSWQAIATGDALLVTDEQQVLTPGAWLLGLLALASVAVLVGGRMSERTRRVGLLKAVGGTPGLVAVALLAENVILALAAAVAGLLIGRLCAPLITSPGSGLVGTPGAPSLTLSIAGQVIAVAVVVALAATLVPAIRAARSSTVDALADAARPPRRRGMLIRLAARLPVPLLFGLRLVARRPRRAVLGAASIGVTVTGLVAVVAFHDVAGEKRLGAAAGLGNPIASRDEQMLLVLTVALVTLAVLNAIVTAWATVLDARHSTALARALGASPRQVSAGLAFTQVIPALPGAILGIPLGIGLFAAASSSGRVVVPPGWWLAVIVLGTLVAVAALTTIPARIDTRRAVASVLGQEA